MEEGDRYTLGLLLELRKLAKKAADANDGLAAEFHELLRSVANPNAPELAKDLPFKVRSFARGSQEALRTMSLNGNIEIARAGFRCCQETLHRRPLGCFWGEVG
jgi:hypothetical protein